MSSISFLIQARKNKIQKIEKFQQQFCSIVKRFALLIIIALVFIVVALANAFSYDVVKQVREKEYYDAPAGTVKTYVCYTTTYGKCYHSKYCGSLWNSSYKTTVYEAKQNGYISCSKCTPREQTTLTLTTRTSHYVYKNVTVTKYPFVLVSIIVLLCVCCIFFTVMCIAALCRNKAKKELQEVLDTYNKLEYGLRQQGCIASADRLKNILKENK